MTDQPFNVSAVFKPRREGGAPSDVARAIDRLTACGVARPEARVDERTGVLLVTFTCIGDPAPVVGRLAEELAADWTLAGEASYPTPPPIAPSSNVSWLPGLGFALTLVLAACLLAGLIPYDFDDGPLGCTLGTLSLGVPLCLAVYAFVRQRATASSTP